MWRRSDLPQRHAARDWLGVEPAPECVCLHPANGLARAYEMNSYQCMATGEAIGAPSVKVAPPPSFQHRATLLPGMMGMYREPYEATYAILSNGKRVD